MISCSMMDLGGSDIQSPCNILGWLLGFITKFFLLIFCIDNNKCKRMKVRERCLDPEMNGQTLYRKLGGLMFCWKRRPNSKSKILTQVQNNRSDKHCKHFGSKGLYHFLYAKYSKFQVFHIFYKSSQGIQEELSPIRKICRVW